MSNQIRNNNLNYSIDSTFFKVNRLFVLIFENKDDRIPFSDYFTSNVEIKLFNILFMKKVYSTLL